MEEAREIDEQMADLQAIESEAQNLAKKYGREGLAQAWGTSTVLLAHIQDFSVMEIILSGYKFTISMSPDLTAIHSIYSACSASLQIAYNHYKSVADWAYTADYDGEPQLRSLLRRFGDLVMELAEDFEDFIRSDSESRE